MTALLALSLSTSQSTSCLSPNVCLPTVNGWAHWLRYR